MNPEKEKEIDRTPESGQNRPVQADSERVAGSANSQGDTDEDTRVRAGVVQGDEEDQDDGGQ